MLLCSKWCGFNAPILWILLSLNTLFPHRPQNVVVGFWPGHPRDYALDPKGLKHKDITEQAMKVVYQALRRDHMDDWNLPEIPDKVPTFRKAMKTVADGNMWIDDEQPDVASRHFDKELIESGNSDIFLDTDVVVLSIQTMGDMKTAQTWFGHLLHTLQDFYSHSNWIELGHQDPHPTLGQQDEFSGIALARRDEPTCKDCKVDESTDTISQKLDRKWKKINCDADGGNVITEKLTTGYYSKKITQKPPNKCSHGGVLPASILTAYDATAYASAKGGINKDSLYSEWTYRTSLHFPAARMAERASIQHFDHLRKLLGNDEEFGAFLGLIDYVSAVVDITPSMAQNLPSVKEHLRYIAQKKAESAALVKYLLVITAGKPRIDTFNRLIYYQDTVPLETYDLSEFIGWVDGLTVKKSVRGLKFGGGVGSVDPTIVRVPIVGGIPVNPGITFTTSEITGKDLIYGWESTYYACWYAGQRMPVGGRLHVYTDEKKTTDTPDERALAVELFNNRNIDVIFHRGKPPSCVKASDCRRRMRRKRAGIPDSRRDILYDFEEFVRYTGGEVSSLDREVADKSLIDGTEGDGLREQEYIVLESSSWLGAEEFEAEFYMDQHFDRSFLSFEFDRLSDGSEPFITLRPINAAGTDSTEELPFSEDDQALKLIRTPGTYKLSAVNVTNGRLKVTGWSSIVTSGNFLLTTPKTDPNLPEGGDPDPQVVAQLQSDPSVSLTMSHPGSVPLKGHPVAGISYAFSVTTTGCSVSRLAVVTSENTTDIITDIPGDQIEDLTRPGEGEAEADTSSSDLDSLKEYMLEIPVPEVDFRIKLVCKEDPEEFERILPTIHRPSRVTLRSSGCRVSNLTASNAASCNLYPGAEGILEVEMRAFIDEPFDLYVRGALVKDYQPKVPISGATPANPVIISLTIYVHDDLPAANNSLNATQTEVQIQVSGQTSGTFASLSQRIIISPNFLEDESITPTLAPEVEIPSTTSSITTSPHGGILTTPNDKTSTAPNDQDSSTASGGISTTEKAPTTSSTTSTTTDAVISSTTTTSTTTTNTAATTTAPPPFSIVWIATAVIRGEDWSQPTAVSMATIQSQGAGQPYGYSQQLQGHLVVSDGSSSVGSDDSESNYFVGAAVVPVRAPAGRGRWGAVKARLTAWYLGRQCDAYCLQGPRMAAGRGNNHGNQRRREPPTPRYRPCDGEVILWPKNGSGRFRANSLPYGESPDAAMAALWQEFGRGRSRRRQRLNPRVVFKCD